MKQQIFFGSIIAVSLFTCGMVFADIYEPNNSTDNAKLLPTQGIVRGATLTAGDNDLYRLIPNKTGKLNVRLIAKWGPGNADLYVYDDELNILAAAGTTTDDETIVIPVIEGQTYYVNVVEVSIGATGDYEIYVDTDAVPTPRKPVRETKVTRDVNCTKVGSLLIRADLDKDAAAGIEILTPAELSAGDSGYAVQVEIFSFAGNLNITALAEPVSFDNTIFRLDMSDILPLPEGRYFVASSVRVADGSQFSAYASGRRSAALILNCKYLATPQ